MLKDYCDLCPLHRYPSFAQSTKEGKRKLLLPHAWDKKNLGIISRSAAITEQSCKKVVKGLYNELCLDPLLVVPGQASQDGQGLVPGSCSKACPSATFFFEAAAGQRIPKRYKSSGRRLPGCTGSVLYLQYIVSTVGFQLLFNFGTFDSFLASLGKS